MVAVCGSVAFLESERYTLRNNCEGLNGNPWFLHGSFQWHGVNTICLLGACFAMPF